jgi:hypothetical protein
VATHVLHEAEHLVAPEQRAAMHGTRGLVGAVLHADGVDDGVQLLLRQGGWGQHQLVHIGHQVAKHTALSATGGHHLAGGPGFDVGNAAARLDGGSADLPIHRDRLDLVHAGNQALVAQVAQHQQLGLRAQGHQGDQFTIVDVDRERTLNRNPDALQLAVFVDSAELARQRQARVGQARQGQTGHDDRLHQCADAPGWLRQRAAFSRSVA